MLTSKFLTNCSHRFFLSGKKFLVGNYQRYESINGNDPADAADHRSITVSRKKAKPISAMSLKALLHALTHSKRVGSCQSSRLRL